tara:strand:+ start:77 stop:442 length:366 start_codon:yes stop_codon:yes gene_type:complete
MAFRLPKTKADLFGYDEKLSRPDRPVFYKDLEDGVLAEANKDKTIFLDISLKNKPKQAEYATKHEDVHLEQFGRGDFDYTDDTVTWKGKTVARAEIQEGNKNLPWEQEAYARVKKPKKNAK